MTVKSVEIPRQTRATKHRFPQDVIEEAASRVKAGETITLLDEPTETRTESQTQGWYARMAIAEHLGVNAKEAIGSRTWPVDNGFMYGVFAKDGLASVATAAPKAATARKPAAMPKAAAKK